MEVIHALEDGPRGVYCGSMGWFGDDGRAHWNVGIRTVTVRHDRARLHVGAGLVIGSDPARELAETDLKAARMAAALEGG
jgi:anthranilate/para-aminobenzoate synthase component I